MRFVLFFILIFNSEFLIGQSLKEKLDSLNHLGVRPKIGLALSGGAAHGLAHVGVIQFLEEQQIPIDYITGTSMGAIIGALYAMGYSSEDLTKVLEGYDWDDIVSNKIYLQEVSSFEKRFHNKIPISLKVEQNKIKLPTAFFEGYKLDLKIAEIYSAAFMISDFGDLPRPFKCYSVNLLNGEVVELKEGSLPDAIRASMAIPSIFAPVEKDSMLLVDGGLIKNFPAKEVKDMGADIVIGVYVGSKRSKLEDINSMTDVLRLTGFMTSLVDTDQQKKYADILIEPDVKDYPLLDFNNYQVLIDKGYAEADSNKKEIVLLAEVLENYPKQPSIIPMKLPPKLFIEEVKVEKKGNVYDEIITKSFTSLIQKNVAVEDFNNSLKKAFATNNLENLKFSLEEGRLGQILNLKYQIKKESTIGISINHFSNTNSAFVVSGLLRNMLFPMTVIRGIARISDNPGFYAQAYKRFGKEKITLFGVEAMLDRKQDPIYGEMGLQKRLINNRYQLGFSLYHEPWLSTAVSVSYSFNARNLKPQELRANDLLEFQHDVQKLEITFLENTLDKWSYPHSGTWSYATSTFIHNVQQEVVFTSEGGEDLLGIPEEKNNASVYGVMKSYIPLSSDWTSETFVSAGFYRRPSLFDYFEIGGVDNYNNVMLPFIGAENGQYRAQEFLYFRQGLRWRVSNNMNISAIGNFLRINTYNTKFLDASQAPLWQSIFGYGLSFGFDTVLGPINIDIGGRSDSEDTNFSIGIGYKHVY